MRDINRIDAFLKELGKIWKQQPDLRFTQLIVNVMFAASSDLYYCEEDKFLSLLKDYYGVK